MKTLISSLLLFALLIMGCKTMMHNWSIKTQRMYPGKPLPERRVAIIYEKDTWGLKIIKIDSIAIDKEDIGKRNVNYHLLPGTHNVVVQWRYYITGPPPLFKQTDLPGPE